MAGRSATATLAIDPLRTLAIFESINLVGFNIDVNQKVWRTAQVLAVLQLLTALSLHGVYTNPWLRISISRGPSLIDAAMILAALLFIVLPIAAVVWLARRRRWGFYPLILFPLTAIVFGTIPVPYASRFFSSNIQYNSVIILVVDVALVAFGIALLMLSKSRVDPRNG